MVVQTEFCPFLEIDASCDNFLGGQIQPIGDAPSETRVREPIGFRHRDPAELEIPIYWCEE